MKRIKPVSSFITIIICIVVVPMLLGGVLKRCSSSSILGSIALIFNIVGIIVSGVVSIGQLSSDNTSGHEWEDGTVIDQETGMTAKEERDNREQRHKAFKRYLWAGMTCLIIGALLQLLALFHQ